MDDNLGTIVVAKEYEHLGMVCSKRIWKVGTDQFNIGVSFCNFLSANQRVVHDERPTCLLAEECRLTIRSVLRSSSRFQKPCTILTLTKSLTCSSRCCLYQGQSTILVTVLSLDAIEHALTSQNRGQTES